MSSSLRERRALSPPCAGSGLPGQSAASSRAGRGRTIACGEALRLNPHRGVFLAYAQGEGDDLGELRLAPFGFLARGKAAEDDADEVLRLRGGQGDPARDRVPEEPEGRPEFDDRREKEAFLADHRPRSASKARARSPAPPMV